MLIKIVELNGNIEVLNLNTGICSIIYRQQRKTFYISKPDGSLTLYDRSVLSKREFDKLFNIIKYNIH